MRYVAPYGIPDPDAPYINGNPTIGQPGSIPPAGAFEYPMRDIHNFISDSALVPANSDLHQISRSVQNGRVMFGVDVGTKNAMVTVLTPAPQELFVGMEIRIKKIGTANDGPVTLNVGLGVHGVKRSNGADLGIGDLPASTVGVFVWDGSQWQLVNFQASTSTTVNNIYNSFDIPYAVDTGTTNHVVAPFAPAITALVAGALFKVQLKHPITGASDIQVNALAPIPLVRPDSSPLQGGEGALNQEMLLMYDGVAIQFCNAGSGGGGGDFSIARSSLNLIGTAPGGTKTATWTAEELVAKSSLGGTSYTGANLTLNFNGATVGPGGMDVGTTPAAADLHIYAIFNPATGNWSTLGTISYRSSLYGGVLPSGYKASSLIWSGKTDANGFIYTFHQRQDEVIVPTVLIFNIGNAGSVALIPQTIAVAVPYNAKTASGFLWAGSIGGGTIPMIASTNSTNPRGVPGPGSWGPLHGHGAIMGTGFAGFVGNVQPTTIFEKLLLITPQTLYWMTGSASTGTDTSLYVSKYQI